MTTDKALYEQLTWPETKEAIADDRVCMVPVGSLEQHGPHCPLNTDTVIVTGICRRVSDALPDRVVLLPPVAYGVSPHHMDFPGTVTIDERPFIDFIVSICSCLAYHGFRRVLLVNGHGGNSSALDIAARTVNLRYPEALCAAVNYFSTPRATSLAETLSSHQGVSASMDHAGLLETSCYLAFDPQPVDMCRAVPGAMPKGLAVAFSNEDRPLVAMPSWSSITPTGVLGDPTNASAQAAEHYLETVVDEMVQLVTDFQSMEVPEHSDQHDTNRQYRWGEVPR